MITFAQAKNSTLKNISGVTVTSQQFKDLLNEAVQMILNRGDFIGSIVPMRICAYRGCVTFPRHIGYVRAWKRCGERLPVGGFWFNFLDPRSSPRHDNLYGKSNAQLTQTGEVSTYADLHPLAPKYLRLYVEYPQDAGKVVTIFGEDSNGQPLVTPNGDGTVKQGLELTLQNPYVQSLIEVRRIDRVVKQETGGRVRLYSVEPDDMTTLIDLAIWDGSDLSPSYRRYQINDGCDASSLVSLEMLVKLAYVPVSADSDLVVIDNLPALKMMMQAIKCRDGGDSAGGAEFERSAIRELNLQISNAQPDSAIPVDMGETGNDPSYQQCF